MVIFLWTTNNTGRKILYTLYPVQVALWGAAPDITAVIQLAEHYGAYHNG